MRVSMRPKLSQVSMGKTLMALLAAFLTAAFVVKEFMPGRC